MLRTHIGTVILTTTHFETLLSSLYTYYAYICAYVYICMHIDLTVTINIATISTTISVATTLATAITTVLISYLSSAADPLREQCRA